MFSLDLKMFCLLCVSALTLSACTTEQMQQQLDKYDPGAGYEPTRPYEARPQDPKPELD